MGLLGKWVESLDYQYEIGESCTRYRSPHSTCQKCVSSCHENAISLVNAKPVIEKNKCIECGNCIASCPEQAVIGIFPKRTIFQNQLVVTNDFLPTVEELLVLYKKGIKSIIYEEPSLIGQWEVAVHEADFVLAQLGEEPFSISLKAIEKQEKLYSRRDLFSLWQKESKSVVKHITPAKWHFNQDSFDVAKYFKDFQFTTITVDIQTCTLCKACQQLCQRDCFEITNEGFFISTKTCSSCQLCVDICPEQSITMMELISPINVTKHQVYKKQCSVCKKTYESLRESDVKCVMCTKREGYL
ncbi:MAG: 4Fe-4S binding protein [Bacillus sp. (in: Bacteria)]|nr:4Fe-4S binding protein [Bacillus sp. (in: firmicutes)]